MRTWLQSALGVWRQSPGTAEGKGLWRQEPPWIQAQILRLPSVGGLDWWFGDLTPLIRVEGQRDTTPNCLTFNVCSHNLNEWRNHNFLSKGQLRSLLPKKRSCV